MDYHVKGKWVNKRWGDRERERDPWEGGVGTERMGRWRERVSDEKGELGEREQGK